MNPSEPESFSYDTVQLLYCHDEESIAEVLPRSHNTKLIRIPVSSINALRLEFLLLFRSMSAHSSFSNFTHQSGIVKCRPELIALYLPFSTCRCSGRRVCTPSTKSGQTIDCIQTLSVKALTPLVTQILYTIIERW